MAEDDAVFEPIDGTLPPQASASEVVALSADFYRLLHAAAIDLVFQRKFLAAPIRTAVEAQRGSGLSFRGVLPDRGLQFTPITLTDTDWAVLRHLAPGSTLTDIWQCIARMGASGASERNER